MKKWEKNIFREMVVQELRLITNARSWEFVKLKIQELLFQAQFNTLGYQKQPT